MAGGRGQCNRSSEPLQGSGPVAVTCRNFADRAGLPASDAPPSWAVTHVRAITSSGTVWNFPSFGARSPQSREPPLLGPSETVGPPPPPSQLRLSIYYFFAFKLTSSENALTAAGHLQLKDIFQRIKKKSESLYSCVKPQTRSQLDISAPWTLTAILSFVVGFPLR